LSRQGPPGGGSGPPALTILAVVGAFVVGQIETASKQADVDAQRAVLAKIEKKVEELVAQGRLSREDAKHILVLMSDTLDTDKFKENLDIKVRNAPPQTPTTNK
jgi:uncharacterized membrane protein